MRHHRPRLVPQEDHIGGDAKRKESGMPGMLGETLKVIASYLLLLAVLMQLLSFYQDS